MTVTEGVLAVRSEIETVIVGGGATRVVGNDMSMLVTRGGCLIRGIEEVRIPTPGRDEVRERHEVAGEFSTDPTSFGTGRESPPGYAVDSENSPTWVIDEGERDEDKEGEE